MIRPASRGRGTLCSLFCAQSQANTSGSCPVRGATSPQSSANGMLRPASAIEPRATANMSAHTVQTAMVAQRAERDVTRPAF